MHYLSIFSCGVLAMVLGFIWYGPLFGKTWMRVTGATAMDLQKRKEMQKKAMPLYILQLILALFQALVLYWYIQTLSGLSSGILTALLIWSAFIMPTIAASTMWNNDSAKIKWTKFLLQAGYQLALFIMFGLILSSPWAHSDSFTIILPII